MGSGFSAYEILKSGYAKQLVSVDAALYPHASCIAELAVKEYDAGRAVPPELAAPVYIRNKVAMTHAEQQMKAKA